MLVAGGGGGFIAVPSFSLLMNDGIILSIFPFHLFIDVGKAKKKCLRVDLVVAVTLLDEFFSE